jgi:outer membrane protein
MEIQQRERKLTQPIIGQIREIIEGIAKKDGFTMILEKSENSVMWAQKELDITDRVIKEYDSSAKKK